MGNFLLGLPIPVEGYSRPGLKQLVAAKFPEGLIFSVSQFLFEPSEFKARRTRVSTFAKDKSFHPVMLSGRFC